VQQRVGLMLFRETNEGQGKDKEKESNNKEK